MVAPTLDAGRPSAQTSPDQAMRVAEMAARIGASVEAVVAGQPAAISTAIACLLSGGHLLIEDIPGVGKTLLAQSLAATVGGSFHRIQGTPDLLPGDVIGTMMPHGDGFEMRFRPGPIFSNVVVFDELNRANPRTQAALLEATEESAVSVDGVTRELPNPFMLVATQNPVEMVGTYPLGEGALDRFAAVVTPGRAAADAEVAVLLGTRGRGQLREVEPVVDITEIAAARAIVASVFVAEPIARYVVALLDATRHHPRVRLGASTRGGVALIGLAKAVAAIAGRHYVVPDDVVAVADPALAHRLLGADADASVVGGRQILAECLTRVPPPSA